MSILNEQQIFISYAHADNQPIGTNRIRWISKLVEDIRTYMPMKGKKAKIITDHAFKMNGKIIERIEKEIEQSSIFIPILSPAYIQSKYCTMERKIFCEKYKDYDERIITVEKLEVENNLPFEEHLRNVFWEKDIENRESLTLSLLTSGEDESNKYFKKIIKLVSSIIERLDYLDKNDNEKSSDGSKKIEKFDYIEKNVKYSQNNKSLDYFDKNSKSIECSKKKYVYLAEPSDNFLNQYDEVKNHLTKKGFTILPKGTCRHIFKENPNKARAKLESDMKNSSFFIQIIEQNVCKSDKNMNYIEKYCKLQYDLSRNITFENKFLWIVKGVISDQEKNKIEQIKWIQTKYLSYEDIHEFKVNLIEELDPTSTNVFSLNRYHYEGIVLASGNIPISIIQDKVQLLTNNIKNVDNLYVEYSDSTKSRLFLLNHNNRLSKQEQYRLFLFSNDQIKPLKI